MAEAKAPAGAPTWRILEGEVRERLRDLPDGSAQTCITSPPYFGLRDYGVEGQIGLEATPDEFVAALVEVFREVRRVLRDDGTLWLNLGDSYAHGTSEIRPHAGGGFERPGSRGTGVVVQSKTGHGCKPKDLLGIPWAVAQALRAPDYHGRIRAERDRVWLAATLDAEGSICGFTHVRADDGSIRTGVHVTITNTVERLLDEAERIWPASRVEHENHGAGHHGSRPSWRWVAHGAEDKALLMREIYPYMIAKREQARLAYAFFEMSVDAKRLGHSPQRDAVREKRAWIVDALSRLNRGEGVDVPAWIGEPPSVETTGWYLRSDIIWAKPNPMPESVTDRPTKAHEYLFLLSKGPRYYYDADAIRETFDKPIPGSGRMDSGKHVGGGFLTERAGRNKRSVWTVATQPFPGAHFATFPPKLIEPCVLAGTSERACGECGAPWRRVVERTPMVVKATPRRESWQASDDHARTQIGGTMTQPPTSRTVGWEPSCGHGDSSSTCVILDPFAGAGTTGLVALRHGRSFVGTELNPQYAEMARQRIRDDAPLLNVGSERA